MNALPAATNKQEICTLIEGIGIIPAVRLSTAEDALFAGEAICASGIPIVEVTLTVPGALKVIRELTRQKTGMIVGAGTLPDVEAAERCLDAGAAFLTTTGLDLELVRFAQERNVAMFPGALTPTEVKTAWKAGADLVKVFPCAQMGGPGYIRALKRPFPQIPLIASGGVDQKNASDFILAGASVLGIGQDLIPPDAIRRREPGWIIELGRRYCRMVRDARNSLKERHI